MTNLHINIGDISVINGATYSLSSVQRHPKIRYHRKPDELYAIIMVDPDAPSPTNPIMRYMLHLLIINNDDIIVPYKPPTPPKNSGLHRYIFYLVKQPKVLQKNQLKCIQLSDTEPIRQKFDLDAFIKYNNLVIITRIYFKTQNI